MADLSITDLAAQLPANSFTESADDVTLSMKTLMGETSVQLADEKVAEFVSKLLAGAAGAQVAYNDANPTTLSSYPNPTFGTPIADGQGGFVATRNHTVSVRVPLNSDEITAASS
ncbi:MAG: hypothetical protein F6K42_15290 [Leptolyngbya sp. SIO1D8]|nr:hypothetical protein [Leptolyngbya sp. SIO1D8]